MGYHQFLEVNGFLTQIIKLCEDSLMSGIDFQMNHLKLESHQAHYIGEKVNCIFGDTLRDTENMIGFLQGVYELPVSMPVTVDTDEEGAVLIRIGPITKEASGDEERTEATD